MVSELLSDIKRLWKARRVRNMMVVYFEEQNRKAMVHGQHNIFEVVRVARVTRERIEREEMTYKRIKKEIIEKWKGKAFKKKER